jgi:hypothetical protein
LANDLHGTDDDAKENRRIGVMPFVPGGWEDSILDEEDEGARRGGKRVKLDRTSGYEAEDEKEIKGKGVSRRSEGMEMGKTKKKSAAREQAAKNARDRKARVLSLSRLNMLSRPKQRG